MKLKEVVRALETLAPTSLAGGWDNVGLLIEPTGQKIVKKIMLTNDLTEDVLNECVAARTDMIISYHPPIFRPLKRLTSTSWKERVVVSCIENKIALFSPHTAFDAVKGGVNDWLISPFGSGITTPIDQSVASKHNRGISHTVSLKGIAPLSGDDDTVSRLVSIPGTVQDFSDSLGITVGCSSKALPEVIQVLSKHVDDPAADLRITKHEKSPIPDHGAGRFRVLEEPIPLKEAVDIVKQHLKLEKVRLAVAQGKDLDSLVTSVAVCAGSGSSVLGGCSASLWITGEMSHHEVLDAVHQGTSVILCEHSNTERGYLRVFKQTLSDLLEDKTIEIDVSAKDRDPLDIV